MRIGAVVLCRLDSQRLPGKVLAEAAGKPLLWYVLTRCSAASILARIIVATSDRGVDDPICEYCACQGVATFRGSAEDVAGRMLACAEEADLDYFFRVNADSPCLEPDLLEQAAALVAESRLDLVTNLFPRSYPYGVSVELLCTATYRRVYPDILLAGQWEHATQYLYRHLDRLCYRNLRREGEDLSAVRLTVDTVDDLKWFRNLASQTLDRWTSIGYEEIVTHHRAWLANRHAANPDKEEI